MFLDTSKIQSILVQCPTWVGDMVMATGAIRTLKNSFPHAKITLCIRPELSALVSGADWCNSILFYDKKKEHKGILGLAKFYKNLASSHYDATVVFPNSFRSGLIAWLSSAKIRIGYERWGEKWMLTHSLPRPKEGKKIIPIYTGLYYTNLVSLIAQSPCILAPELPLSEKENTQGKEIWEKILKQEKKMKIVVTPGASFGSSKLWPKEYFAQAMDLIASQYPAAFILSPGPGEDAIARDIAKLAQTPVTIFPSQEGSLSFLKAILCHADILISNDTGPRHIAHAFKIPSVILMGPTDPRHTENDLENTIVLQNKQIPCVPCQLKQCPYSHHNCMRQIFPQQVAEACQKLLR